MEPASLEKKEVWSDREHQECEGMTKHKVDANPLASTLEVDASKGHLQKNFSSCGFTSGTFPNQIQAVFREPGTSAGG
ncbi:hypothetical protein J1605_003993 [Eschrichtius robustus]|uniref:Uncharacterized protein n=1 Tax=Eschrichtius robustus TaxID=9764 RepID=A0AB34HNZ0_ESCRO|nr:hypothetical protein J1605_003993 [Eschrichtius robustus]